MTGTHHLQKLRLVISRLFLVVVIFASMLLAIIQPMMAKRILRSVGATWSVWLETTLYFQFLMLASYCLTTYIAKKPIKTQVAGVLALGVLAVISFYSTTGEWRHLGNYRIIGQLFFSTFPAVLLLSGILKLAALWLNNDTSLSAKKFFAVWSFSAFVGSLVYGVWLERVLNLGEQIFYLHCTLMIICGILAAIAFLVARVPREQIPPPENVLSNGSVIQRCYTVLLSAVTWVALLGTTYLLVLEIGSQPIAWIAPLALYFLSSSVVFSGRWQDWMTYLSLVALAIVQSGFMVSKGFSGATINEYRAVWLLALGLGTSTSGNAIIYSENIRIKFSHTYSSMLLGSALGTVSAIYIIPRFLSVPMELPMASCVLSLAGLIYITARREIKIVTVGGAVVFAPVIILGIAQLSGASDQKSKTHYARDVNRSLSIKIDDHSVVLSNGTTIEGTQLTYDRLARQRPTLYSTESSAVGRIIDNFIRERSALVVGVIGVGAGTLAAYARPSDHYIFWDDSSLALQAASERCFFLKESGGRIDLVVEDGRRGLEKAREDFDIIILDALPGDGLPPHLLTTEAFATYADRLRAKHGVLVINASSRYCNISPIVNATAKFSGLAAIDVITEIRRALPLADWDAARTEYLVVAPSSQIDVMLKWFPLSEDGDRITRNVSVSSDTEIHPKLIWSDSRNSFLDVFELGKFLFH